MTTQQDYWQECVAIAAEECEATLTKEQIAYIASAAESAHEHYGLAFYSPPPSERISGIEDEWRKKLARLQKEFDDYQSNAETAIRQALRVHRDVPVTIGEYGEVLRHDGRTERIQ